MTELTEFFENSGQLITLEQHDKWLVVTSRARFLKMRDTRPHAPSIPSRRGSAAPNQRVELAGLQLGGAVEAAEMGLVGGLLGVQPRGQQSLLT